MDFYYLKEQFESHPILTLLRSRNNALILSFFQKVFKDTGKITLEHEDLVFQLAYHIEDCGEREEEGRDLIEESQSKLSIWCDDNHQFLRKYLNIEGKPVYELTSYSEKALRWIDDIKEKEFIGTESRFTDIFTRLKTLAERSVDDPEKRIEDLKQQRKEINAEIREIRKTGRVQSYTEHQVTERFTELSRDARNLVADFKEVEENFKSIVSRIYEEEIGQTKGSVLNMTLDATDELQESPQGKSFYNFWTFLMTDYGKDQINQYVESIYSLLPSGSYQKDVFLKKLKHYLHQAGKKVIDTNLVLTDKINRLLSEAYLLESKRIKELADGIKTFVLKGKDNLPDSDFYVEIEGGVEIDLPMERPLQLPQKTVEFRLPEFEDEGDETDLSELFNQFFVDTRLLHERIRNLLKMRNSVCLEEVLTHYPVSKGLSEILAYLDIASRKREYHILEDQFFSLTITTKGGARRVSIPQAVFHQ
ncbi:MAG: DUF3375 domain-containing protein [Spirochaetia bacterium]